MEVIEGDAKEVLPTLEAGWADAMFIDADKPGYCTYLQEGLRIVRPGGLIMVDNAFASGRVVDETQKDASTTAIRELNDTLAACEELHGVMVPLGDG